MALVSTSQTQSTKSEVHPRVAAISDLTAAYRVSGALATVTALTAALTFFLSNVLRGPAVMDGSARGTALVMLVVAVPLLVTSMILVSRGSVRGVVSWIGTISFLLYNSLLFLFTTPFNSLFLFYCAMCSLALWAAITTLKTSRVDEFASHFGRDLPARGIAIYLWAIAGLNALAWLARIVPELASGKPPEFVIGTGLPTNPIFVLDLSFWIPLTAISALWLWRCRPWGYLLAGTVLVYGVIESVTIAVDQYMGHAADPASNVASDALTVPFLVLALIGLIPLTLYMRHLHGQEPGRFDSQDGGGFHDTRLVQT